MGYARRHPEPVKYKRGGTQLADIGELSGVSHQRVSEARAILEHSRELAEAVVLADKFLNEALVEARFSRGSVRNARLRKAKLHKTRPDLAELVDAE